MILFYREETPERAFVHAINWVKNEVREGVENAIAVNELPPDEAGEGQKGMLYINPKTNEIWYEYVEKPLTDVESLRKEIDTLKSRLATAEGRILTAEGKLTTVENRIAK